ncbi:MAG: M15 family metallopeptidase [Lachnospiraceae bacterium]|nr:M15 family metallopeptidase [Lachnospiraceae bacterium]
MINQTKKERVSEEIRKRGRKNKTYRFFSPLIKKICFFRIDLCDFCEEHMLKFVLLCTSLVCFTAFCSFSFPLFTGSITNLGIIDFNELDESISLAEEKSDVMTADEARIFFRDDFVTRNSDGLGSSVSTNSEGQEVIAIGTDDILEDMLEQFPDDEVQTADASVYEDIDLDSLVFDKNDWRLILVNKQHSVPADYDFPLGNLTENLQCDERVIDDLVQMLRDARSAGMNIWIVSPYRSGDKQENLFNYDLGKYMSSGMNYFDAYQLAAEAVTLPGTSEHQIGLAFDIVNNEYAHLGEGFGETKEGLWLAENCYKYGFILRYPADKEYITTIEYEPWHFRYVGREAAAYMTFNDLTLEEFWEEVF